MGSDYVQTLGDGRVFIDYGPVSMVLAASDGERMLSGLCADCFHIVQTALKELAEYLPVLRRFPSEINPEELTGLPRKMAEAVLSVGEPTLTPMAAVAGAIADTAADWIFERGASLVTVNNGGDIAVRLREGRSLRVGIMPNIDGGRVDEVILFDAADGIGGVCTSGLGGRSFTRGIANAVTVFSARCIKADACATHIANCSYVESPNVHIALAGEIDPTSDITMLRVVTGTDPLAEGEIVNGLQQMEREIIRQRAAGNLICAIADIQGKRIHIPPDHKLFNEL